MSSRAFLFQLALSLLRTLRMLRTSLYPRHCFPWTIEPVTLLADGYINVLRTAARGEHSDSELCVDRP